MTLLYLGFSFGVQGEVGWEGSWDLLQGRQLISSHCVSHRSKLSNVHFLLLVFLKLPLFLGMLIPRMLMFILAISCLTTSNLP